MILKDRWRSTCYYQGWARIFGPSLATNLIDLDITQYLVVTLSWVCVVSFEWNEQKGALRVTFLRVNYCWLVKGWINRNNYWADLFYHTQIPFDHIHNFNTEKGGKNGYERETKEKGKPAEK